MMLRIEAPHFVGGVVFSDGGRVSHAAPIVRYMKEWTADEVHRYCERKRWRCESVPRSAGRRGDDWGIAAAGQ